jgi:hypothetical protein
MKNTALVAALFSAIPIFGVPVLQEGFEAPITSGYSRLVSGSDIPGWTVLHDNDGERAFLLNEKKFESLGVDVQFFGNQALVLNEGTGIETSVPLIAGETYAFSVFGYGNLSIPLQVTIGSLVTQINFLGFSQGGLQERTFTFVATESTDTALLQIFNPDFGLNKDYRQRTIDNVSLVRVPDGGATAALLGLGILSVTLFRRRAVV